LTSKGILTPISYGGISVFGGNIWLSCPRENVPMKGEKIELSQRQLQRFRVMGLVEVERITLREAAGKMGLSYRQAKRIWKRVREKGVLPRPPHCQTSFSGPSGADPSSAQKSIPCSGG
jgi:hypothetical protein